MRRRLRQPDRQLSGQRTYDRARGLLRARRPRWKEYVATVRAAASMRVPAAMQEYGHWLVEGFSRHGQVLVRRSPRRGFTLLLSASVAGDRVAAAVVGNCYDFGWGVAKNPREALRWYRRAVRRGATTCAWNVALVYRDLGNSRMYRRWQRRAAEIGTTGAVLWLAEDAVRDGAPPRLARLLRRRLRKVSLSRAESRKHRGEAALLLAQLTRQEGGGRAR
jgi:hypothetical protein